MARGFSLIKVGTIFLTLLTGISTARAEYPSLQLPCGGRLFTCIWYEGCFAPGNPDGEFSGPYCNGNGQPVGNCSGAIACSPVEGGGGETPSVCPDFEQIDREVAQLEDETIGLINSIEELRFEMSSFERIDGAPVCGIGGGGPDEPSPDDDDGYFAGSDVDEADEDLPTLFTSQSPSQGAEKDPEGEPKKDPKDDPCQKLGNAVAAKCNEMKGRIGKCIDDNRQEIEFYLKELTRYISQLRIIIGFKVGLIRKQIEDCKKGVKIETSKELTERLDKLLMYDKYVEQIQRIIRGLRNKRQPFLEIRRMLCSSVCELLSKDKPRGVRLVCFALCTAGTASCEGVGVGVQKYCSDLDPWKKIVIDDIIDLLGLSKG